jgi:hypothetical protein
MSGRIRTIKPELLEDEKTASLEDDEFRLFVALLLLADDYGNFRANPMWLGNQVWWLKKPGRPAAEILEGVFQSGLVDLYEVSSQPYGHLTGWEKHQRVDKPSKPRVPGIEEADYVNTRESVARVSRAGTGDDSASSESVAPDLRPPTSDHDLRSGGTERSVGERTRKPDLPSEQLSDIEAKVATAITTDPNLSPITPTPNQCARDLCAIGPAVDVVTEVRHAGAWLRANPTKVKKNGPRFLLGWISREQERGGSCGYTPQHRSALPQQRAQKYVTPPPEPSAAELAASLAASQRALLSIGGNANA